MQKIVINSCYGGFGLSEQACQILGIKQIDSRYIKRDNPELIKLMEEKGSEFCSGKWASLKVVEIPDGVEWEIEEEDGDEWVSEVHRTWR